MPGYKLESVCHTTSVLWAVCISKRERKREFIYLPETLLPYVMLNRLCLMLAKLLQSSFSW